MARSTRARSLRKIVQVRATQEAAVQMQLARCATQRHNIEKLTELRDERLERERGLWSAAISQVPVHLTLSGVWSMAMLDSRIALAQLSEQMRANEAELIG